MEGNNNGNENVGQGEIQEKAIRLPIVRVGDECLRFDIDMLVKPMKCMLVLQWMQPMSLMKKLDRGALKCKGEDTIKTSSWEHKRSLPTKSQSLKEENTAGSKERDCESPQMLEGADVVSRILVELRNGVDRSGVIDHHTTIASPNIQLSSHVSTGPSLSGMVVSDNKELEKNWHYQDPSGKIQGPFCMLQLRKWNTNGYFPINLRIWRVDENHDQSILLIDALT
ncbi:hypothetical protein Dimus_023375 [Dionaea muscipula]